MGTTEIWLAAISLLAGIVAYFFARKDAQQAEFIKDLYDKHKEDSEKLIALELEIAKNFHPKAEVQKLFQDFRDFLDERFNRLEQSISPERRKAEQKARCE